MRFISQACRQRLRARFSYGKMCSVINRLKEELNAAPQKSQNGLGRLDLTAGL